MTVNTDPLCPQQHTHPKHNPNRCIFCEYGAAVRAAALDAAREAVAERESEFMRITESDRDSWACRIYGDALAAIDALRRLDTTDCLCPTPNPDCQHPTCPRLENQ